MDLLWLDDEFCEESDLFATDDDYDPAILSLAVKMIAIATSTDNSRHERLIVARTKKMALKSNVLSIPNIRLGI